MLKTLDGVFKVITQLVFSLLKMLVMQVFLTFLLSQFHATDNM